jgi:hypothetical protein
MSAGQDTILGAVLGVGAITFGAILRLSFQQGAFHGSVREFMAATLRRLKRLEDQDDRRTNGGR